MECINKEKHRLFRWIVSVLLFGFLLFPAGLRGQALSESEKPETVPFYRRFSFHTNVVDWVLTVPNMSVEFDLQRTERTRFSLLMTGKFNWNTSHTRNPRLVWNVQSGTVELRKYWRTGSHEKLIDVDTTRTKVFQLFQRFHHHVLSGQCLKNPRNWRAYYVGGAAGVDKYTFCFGKKGKQGRGAYVGITAGYDLPLYGFKNGTSIDLELGAMLAAKLVSYEDFHYESESACYAYERSSGKHFVPYPVVQDIHVSLVYRLNSIANKVKGGAERYHERRVRLDSLQALKFKAAENRWYEKNDKRIRRANEKKAERAERHRADSLERLSREIEKRQRQLEKDSLRAARQTADSIAKAERLAQKEARRNASVPNDSLERTDLPVQESVERTWEDTLQVEREPQDSSGGIPPVLPQPDPDEEAAEAVTVEEEPVDSTGQEQALEGVPPTPAEEDEADDSALRETEETSVDSLSVPLDSLSNEEAETMRLVRRCPDACPAQVRPRPRMAESLSLEPVGERLYAVARRKNPKGEVHT